MSLFPSILNDYLEVCLSVKRSVGVLVAVEPNARHNAALQDIPFTHLSDVSEKIAALSPENWEEETQLAPSYCPDGARERKRKS